MKFVITLLLLITLGGSVFAADTPATTTEPTVTTAPTTDATPTVTTSETAKPTDQPAPDAATDQKKKRTVFALSAGLYMPVNGQVKDIYGDNFLRLGIRPLPTNAPKGWRFAYDVNWISLESINGKATIIPITAGVLRRFGKNDVKSYAALNVGPYYGNVKVPALGIDKTGWGWDANATLGVVFKERFCLEARYDLMNKFAGLDFDSLTISAAIRIFTAKL